MSSIADLTVIGVGSARPGRNLTRTLDELILEAALAACTDAGLSLRDIDGIVSESTYGHPTLVETLHTVAGLSPSTFTAHIGLSGSGTLASTLLADGAIRAGRASLVMCVYGLKFPDAIAPAGGAHDRDPLIENLEVPFGQFPQPVYMAAMAQRYCAQYGVDPDMLGYVPVSARAWAALNPNAMRFGRPLDIETYRQSPLVATPLRAEDCCLISDGACAFIMASSAHAAAAPHPPVRVLAASRAVEAVTEREYLTSRVDKLRLPSRFSGPAALSEAQLSPADIDALYLYDCFSIIPLLQLEDVGFCQPGEAADLYARGEASPGGATPINTDGGLMANMYMPGMNMIIEAVGQLRGTVEPNRQIRDIETAFLAAWGGHEHTSIILARA